MSVHAEPLDHRASVLFALLTHAVAGGRPAAVVGRGSLGAVAGLVLPDVDLVFVSPWSLFVLGLRGLTLEHRRFDRVVPGQSPVRFERR